MRVPVTQKDSRTPKNALCKKEINPVWTQEILLDEKNQAIIQCSLIKNNTVGSINAACQHK